VDRIVVPRRVREATPLSCGHGETLQRVEGPTNPKPTGAVDRPEGLQRRSRSASTNIAQHDGIGDRIDTIEAQNNGLNASARSLHGSTTTRTTTDEPA